MGLVFFFSFQYILMTIIPNTIYWVSTKPAIDSLAFICFAY